MPKSRSEIPVFYCIIFIIIIDGLDFRCYDSCAERRIKNIIPITGVRISVCRGLRNEIKMYFIRFDKIVTIEMSKLSEYIIPRRETYL